MAVRVILEVQAKPGTGDEVVAFFRSILPETRAYEGCTSVDALQNSDDADNMVVVEVWDSHEQYKEYLCRTIGQRSMFSAPLAGMDTRTRAGCLIEVN